MYKLNSKFLRPKKASVLQEWHETPFEKKKGLEIWSGHEATILPLKRVEGDSLLFGRAGVVDSQGEYVQLSAIKQRIDYSYPVQNVVYRDEKVVYCGYLVKQWGHFLVEAVSRLWYFLENNESVVKYVFVVGENEPCTVSGNYKEFLELLGVYDKLEIINKPIKFKEVIVPELGYKWRRHYSDSYKNIFDVVVANANYNKEWRVREKVYMSRSKLKKISNIECGNDMLDDYFEKNGYYVVYPEKISLSELIFLLNNCEECASISGTLPHNMLFAKDKSKLVVIERNVLNNEIQADVNRIKELDVTYVDANIPLYSVNLGYGPFIMAYNNKLELFTKERDYVAPNERYLSEKYLKTCFVRYMKAYSRAYRYQWFMEDWSIAYCNYIREGYKDGIVYYGKYINGLEPFRWYHYFMPHYWKQMIKRIIRR